MLGVPVVLISVVEGTRQVLVGSHGLPEMRDGGSSPLCREVAIAGRPIIFQDARRRLPSGERGPWGFELVGYAGVALNMQAPSRVGALAALSPIRRAWQSYDLQILRTLADTAAAILDMHAGCEELLGDQAGAADKTKVALA